MAETASPAILTAPSGEDVILAEPTETTSEPAQPVVDDYACETLYIQNLNEKIKPEGVLEMLYFLCMCDHIYCSHERIFAWTIQGLWRGY